MTTTATRYLGSALGPNGSGVTTTPMFPTLCPGQQRPQHHRESSRQRPASVCSPGRPPPTRRQRPPSWRQSPRRCRSTSVLRWPAACWRARTPPLLRTRHHRMPPAPLRHARMPPAPRRCRQICAGRARRSSGSRPPSPSWLRRGGQVDARLPPFSLEMQSACGLGWASSLPSSSLGRQPRSHTE